MTDIACPRRAIGDVRLGPVKPGQDRHQVQQRRGAPGAGIEHATCLGGGFAHRRNKHLHDIGHEDEVAGLQTVA